MAVTIDLGRVVGEAGKDSVQKYNYSLVFPASGWTEQSDGSFTQQAIADGMLASDSAHVDIDMCEATKDNYYALVDAWGMITRAQTQSGSLLLTSFDGAPEVDLTVKVEVIR